ncbi:pyridoxal phosphate-dependent decarboxylase family protein [Sediminicola arcticus]|jgi:L-2,4-diaminobutyrate decarboxylase|uniref:Aminotransferase class I/II-fold pyridoxal phosphate-dependent enzyme n=1 Tax=Sediminicola arcticus TaxID=1574308 RepID=A0ABV2SXU3_9FLAO
MKNDLLQKAYDPEEFRSMAHQLVDQLADHLDNTIHEKSEKTISWNTPKDEHEFWMDYLKNGDSRQLFPEVLNHTIHIHHPKYMGHQVAPTLPITALSGMVASVLNNGMAVYEMGMAPTAMERIITDFICKKIGYDSNSNGFLTSGGTLANLTALLAARKAKLSHNVWNDGNNERLGIIVSEEAHYCVDRAARIMGLGEEGIIKIPATKDFALDTKQLESYYQKAEENGIKVFAIIGSAPSTSTGIFDDLETIANFSHKHNLWFHVDGAHGGASIFSKTYKYLVKGIDMADSVVIDGHKMMMMPALTTALLFKDGTNSHATFIQKADYLLEQSAEEDWYNLAKRTFECTKTMMSLHWFTLLKIYGAGIFDDYVNTLYDLGHQFAAIIKKDKSFDIAVEPMSNIVCFRYVNKALDNQTLNSINEKVRQALLEDGEFYIVQTKLRGIHYLRTTLMNPFTNEKHLVALLNKIKTLVHPILTQS